LKKIDEGYKMVEKTKEDNIKNIETTMSKIEALRAKRQALDDTLYTSIKGSGALFKEGIDQKNVDKIQKTQSKLDADLASYKDFQMTLGELTSGFISGLENYTDFAENWSNYQGMEKFIKFFSVTSANRRRQDRWKLSTPGDNLRRVLDYAGQTVIETLKIREGVLEHYNQLEAETDLVVAKLEEFQPKEAALKEKLDARKAIEAEMQEKLKTANASEQKTLESQLNDYHKETLVVDMEYRQVFTTYKVAQESLEANKLSRQSFENMMLDLGTQAKLLQEKMENIEQVYNALPEALKVAKIIKGGEIMDKTINVTTSKVLSKIVATEEAVHDSTAKRLETQFVTAEEMRSYIETHRATVADYNERFEKKIRPDALQSQKERYGTN
jgi:hypothetical protein